MSMASVLQRPYSNVDVLKVMKKGIQIVLILWLQLRRKEEIIDMVETMTVFFPLCHFNIIRTIKKNVRVKDKLTHRNSDAERLSSSYSLSSPHFTIVWKCLNDRFLRSQYLRLQYVRGNPSPDMGEMRFLEMKLQTKPRITMNLSFLFIPISINSPSAPNFCA